MFNNLILFSWCFSIISFLLYNNNLVNHKYINFGYSQDLYILESKIDDKVKYFFVIFYIFINTFIKKICYKEHYSIVNYSSLITVLNFYKLFTISNIYYYIDWFININICFAQLDLFIITVLFDFIGHLFYNNYKNNINMNYNILNQQDLEHNHNHNHDYDHDHGHDHNHNHKHKKLNKKNKSNEKTPLIEPDDILKDYNTVGYVYM